VLGNKQTNITIVILATLLILAPAIVTGVFLWFLLMPQTFWEKLAYLVATLILIVIEYNIIAEVVNGEVL